MCVAANPHRFVELSGFGKYTLPIGLEPFTFVVNTGLRMTEDLDVRVP